MARGDDTTSINYALNSKQITYLEEIAKLFKEHKAANSASKKHIFAKMIRLFMTEVCRYPENSFLITTSVYGDEDCGSYPHVVPISFYANTNLFYFVEPGADLELQDLWVQHAEVYLLTPTKDDSAKECATQVILSDFYNIGGARRNPVSNDWNRWALKDIPGTKEVSFDLRRGAEEKELSAGLSLMFKKRLKSFEYMIPPEVDGAKKAGHEKLAELMRNAGHNSTAYSTKAKRGEGPLDLPIYKIELIESNRSKTRPAAILATEEFTYRSDGQIKNISKYLTNGKLDQNMLVCGDNLSVIKRLQETHGAFIDLIYIDPPFCSNRDYEYRAGNSGYTDKWSDGLSTFVPWLMERIIAMKSLLTSHGQFYINLDHHAAHYIKVELDKVFGGTNFRNEIIWHFPSMSATKTDFPRKHQNIFRYTNSATWTFNANDVRVPYAEATVSRANYGGAGFAAADSTAGYLNEKGKIPDTVWTVPHIKGAEHTKYDNQKPERLLERIVLASTKPGDVVADFFLGSGTTCVVAQKLGRKWVGVDANPQAIEVSADRIRSIAKQKEKPIGISIPKFKDAIAVGYRKFTAGLYNRDQIGLLEEVNRGSGLSEYQEFILDCYLPNESRKGDTKVHAIRTYHGEEIAVFVGPNHGELKATLVIEFLQNLSKKAEQIQKVEILGWSFSPSLVRRLRAIAEEFGKSINLKRIHIVDTKEIEFELGKRNVHFLPAARATVEFERKGRSMSCEIKLQSPASEVSDVHWFIYPDRGAELSKIEYNFIKRDANNPTNDLDFIESEPEAAEDKETKKKNEKKLDLCHTFKDVKDGIYRVYVRVTNRRGYPTSIIENVKVISGEVKRISEAEFEAYSEAA